MKFQENETYQTRSIGDNDCIISVTIKKRTAKTVVTIEDKRFRIYEYEGVERIRPWGSYSMCPSIGADQIVAVEPTSSQTPDVVQETGEQVKAKDLKVGDIISDGKDGPRRIIEDSGRSFEVTCNEDYAHDTWNFHDEDLVFKHDTF